MNKSCLLSGVGGQGVVLGAKLIAYAAMNKGLFARTTDTIGMAQRGGSVVSHVRIGEEIHSPIIPLGTADLILGFEPGEAVRALPFLRPEGAMIVSNQAVMPVTATLAGGYNPLEMLDYLQEHIRRLSIIDGEQICSDLGTNKALNVALLGAAAASGALDIDLDDLRLAICQFVPQRFQELNLRALAYGAEAWAKQG